MRFDQDDLDSPNSSSTNFYSGTHKQQQYYTCNSPRDSFQMTTTGHQIHKETPAYKIMCVTDNNDVINIGCLIIL